MTELLEIVCACKCEQQRQIQLKQTKIVNFPSTFLHPVHVANGYFFHYECKPYAIHHSKFGLK